MPRCRPLPSMIARPAAGGRVGRGQARLRDPAVAVGDLDPHAHGVDHDPHDELGPGMQHRVCCELVRRDQQRVGQLAAVVVAQQVLQRLPQEPPGLRHREGVRLELAADFGSGHHRHLPRQAAPTRSQAAGLVISSTR